MPFSRKQKQEIIDQVSTLMDNYATSIQLKNLLPHIKPQTLIEDTFLMSRPQRDNDYLIKHKDPSGPVTFYINPDGEWKMYID